MKILHTQIEQLITLSHQLMMLRHGSTMSLLSTQVEPVEIAGARRSLAPTAEIVRAILSRLLKLLSKEELFMAGHFLSIFNELLSGFIPKEKSLFGNDIRILKAQEFIEKNYDKPVRLQDVARHVGLSECALSRLFRKQTAKTFIEYLNDVRIEHSVNLLRKTDDLISGIAYSCGFSSSRHFAKVFRGKKGVAPGAFRRPFQGYNKTEKKMWSDYL